MKLTCSTKQQVCYVQVHTIIQQLIHVPIYCGPIKTSPFLFFEQLHQNRTDFNNFGIILDFWFWYETILRKFHTRRYKFVHLPSNCRHCTLKYLKVIFQ